MRAGPGRHGWLTVMLTGLLALMLVLSAATSASAHAAAVHTAKGQSSTCSQPAQGQPFLADGDFNYYFPAPGLSGTGIAGTHWILGGGAKIVTTRLANGSTRRVLDLPAGSQAMSPDLCVIPGQNPLAQAMIQSLGAHGGLQANISYFSSGAWTKPQGAGGVNGGPNGWALSNPINIPPSPPVAGAPPGPPSGWQIVRFTFTAPPGPGAFQMYGLSIAALPSTPSTAACTDPVLTQPFLSFGDRNYYTPAPGQSARGFVGTGWTLTGGAKIVTVTQADGSSGRALDLPAGSMAVSPDVCVTSLYPTARMMVRGLFGGGDVSFRVSYAETNSWTNPHETGHVKGKKSGWTLSDPVQLQPNHVQGWQIVRLTLVPGGGHSEFQVYNLELDPYARG
jgi:hypothetical protein